jgi:hypothetical protein
LLLIDGDIGIHADGAAAGIDDRPAAALHDVA